MKNFNKNIVYGAGTYQYCAEYTVDIYRTRASQEKILPACTKSKRDMITLLPWGEGETRTLRSVEERVDLPASVCKGYQYDGAAEWQEGSPGRKTELLNWRYAPCFCVTNSRAAIAWPETDSDVCVLKSQYTAIIGASHPLVYGGVPIGPDMDETDNEGYQICNWGYWNQLTDAQIEVMTDTEAQKGIGRFNHYITCSTEEEKARTLLGHMGYGSFVFVTTQTPMTLEEAAQMMADLGCDYAVNLGGEAEETAEGIEGIVGTPICVCPRSVVLPGSASTGSGVNTLSVISVSAVEAETASQSTAASGGSAVAGTASVAPTSAMTCGIEIAVTTLVTITQLKTFGWTDVTASDVTNCLAVMKTYTMSTDIRGAFFLGVVKYKSSGFTKTPEALGTTAKVWLSDANPSGRNLNVFADAKNLAAFCNAIDIYDTGKYSKIKQYVEEMYKILTGSTLSLSLPEYKEYIWMQVYTKLSYDNGRKAPTDPQIIQDWDAWTYTVDGQQFWYQQEVPAPQNINHPLNTNAYAQQSWIQDGVTVIRQSSNAYTDTKGRYWAAVGPNILNPDRVNNRTDGVMASEVRFGTEMDVIVRDRSSGEIGYVYILLGDVKEHTYPLGLYQTGEQIGTYEFAADNVDGSWVEFFGAVDLGPEIYPLEFLGIIVYD